METISSVPLNNHSYLDGTTVDDRKRNRYVVGNIIFEIVRFSYGAGELFSGHVKRPGGWSSTAAKRVTLIESTRVRK